MPGQGFGALADALCCPSSQELEASSPVPAVGPEVFTAAMGMGAWGWEVQPPGASDPHWGQRWPRLGSKRNRWVRGWHLEHWHFSF